MYAILKKINGNVNIKLSDTLSECDDKNCKIFYNPNFIFKNSILTIFDKNDSYEIASGSWKLEYVDLNFTV